jgi:uncharacterized protein YfaP (DUF2135 family)
MPIKRSFLVIPLIAALSSAALRCGKHATEPGSGSAVFVLRPHFTDAASPAAPSSASKPNGRQAIDQVRILVLDMSRYDSWDEFIATAKGQRFLEEQSGEFAETVTWAEWQRFYGSNFLVVSDQALAVNDTAAVGTVTGVLGLNRFVIGFVENDSIRFSGEAAAVGRSGKPQEVEMQVGRWAAGQRMGSIAVRSEPAGAAVYLDGARMDVTTPGVLTHVGPGHHRIRMYLDGYNEYNIDVDMGYGGSTTVDAPLAAPTFPRPVFTIAEPADSARFQDNVIRVRGTVELSNANGARSPYPGTEAVLTLNGAEKTVTVSAGSFDETISVASGENVIRLRANSAEGNTGVSAPLRVFGDFVGANIEITLTWNSPTSDLDLHVWNPAGEESYYGHKQITDGFLDIDDQEGYGPETFTSNAAMQGTYAVKVQRYSMDRDTVSDATVQIQINGGTPRIYGPHRFTSALPAVWDVTSFAYGSQAAKAVDSGISEGLERKIGEDMAKIRTK